MFVKRMQYSIFYCLCFVEEISENISDIKVTEEKDPYPEWEEGFNISDDREEHWKEVKDQYDEYRVSSIP